MYRMIVYISAPLNIIKDFTLSLLLQLICIFLIILISAFHFFHPYKDLIADTERIYETLIGTLVSFNTLLLFENERVKAREYVKQKDAGILTRNIEKLMY